MLPALATWPRLTQAFRGLTTTGGRATRFWVRLARFAWAIGLTALTVYAMRWIEVQDDLAAVPFSLVVLLALLTTAFSGLRLAVAATILACAGAVYVVFPPYRSFAIADQSQWFRLVASGVIALIVALLYELLERQSARSRELAGRLADANAAKDQFIGHVSHDLRTPLTVIIGNASILLRASAQLDETSRHETLTDIVASGERLQRMIDNLLALARAEAQLDTAEEPVIVHQVVANLFDAYRRRHPERQINLEVSREATPIVCAWASAEEVIDNLLSNAEKYSPPDRPIDVSVQVEPHALVISVADRGPGFGGVNVARLFEPFVRSDSARAAAPGLGIGLSVAQRLVQAHGGRIWARDRDGGGAEVTFSLPAYVVAGEDEDAVSAHVASGRTDRPGNRPPLSGRNHHAPY